MGFRARPGCFEGIALAVAAKPVPELRLLALVACVTLLVAGSALAEQAPSPLNLGWLLKTALAESPQIRASDARYRAMAQRPVQEGTLPDPSVGWRLHNEDFGRFTLGDSEFSYYEFSAEQEVPFPGKLGLRESAATHAAERERAMRDVTVLEVLAKVVIAHSQLTVADRATAILTESVQVLDTMTKQAAENYSVGSAAQQDVLRAALERDALRERLAMLALERKAAESVLNALLNRAATEPLGATQWSADTLALEPLDALTHRLKSGAPELRAAQEEVLRADDRTRLAQREYFPDFSVMGAYMNKNGLFAEWEVGLKLTLPLYFWRRQTPALEEAAYEREAAVHSQRNAQVSLAGRLRELHSVADTALRLIDLYGDVLIPQASLTLESARASYAVGKVDFLTTLTAFNSLLEYKVRHAEQVGQFRRAVAEIGPLIGEHPRELQVAGRR